LQNTIIEVFFNLKFLTIVTQAYGLWQSKFRS